MNRHTEREKALVCVYQYLLTKNDLTTILKDTFQDEPVSAFVSLLVHQSIDEKERYSGYINEVLKDWTFDRLGYIEQAILLMACTEFDQQTAHAPVIIDEAIRLAKTYCDEDAYKLINGVLDRL